MGDSSITGSLVQIALIHERDSFDSGSVGRQAFPSVGLERVRSPLWFGGRVIPSCFLSGFVTLGRNIISLLPLALVP